MGYIYDVEAELGAMLAELEITDPEDVKAVAKFVKDRVLESYRNGLEAGKRGGADKKAERKPRTFAREK